MNPILDKLLNRSVTNWTPLSDDDENLYIRCFKMSNNFYCYENNWALIIQESRYGGVKYWDEQNLLTLVSKNISSDFVFLFIASLNLELIPSKIQKIVSDIMYYTGKRVIVRKISPHLVKQIQGYSKIRLVNPNEFFLTNELPEDIFPQVVVNIRPIIQMSGSSWARVRNHISHFEQHHVIEVHDLTVESANDALEAINEWNSHKSLVNKTDKPLTFDASAFGILANKFSKKIDNKLYFAKITYANNSPIAFQFAGGIANDAAALYSNIVLTNVRGATEKCLKEFCRHLLEHNIQHLNLGGSEFQGLFEYKCKFQPFDYIRTYDIEFDLE